ncbi:MAG TPA: BatA domain-containing protein, partial [Verrucomicrobiota bacterium]|nr:BatA domain-containing protein [Verrucomicrobiota bacterium]
MSFLAPLFWLGALAVAGPILFHLIRRAARERMPFSSVMFLRPTPPRMTKRSRLEHISLLILRCLCLILLAAAFARPFFRRDVSEVAPASEGRQAVLLIDTSASMRRDNLWEDAVAAARRHLEKVAHTDQFAVLAFDRQPRTLVTFSEWSNWSPAERAALAAQRIA